MILLAEEGVVLNTAYILMILAGAGGVIAFLFRLLITSREREHNLLAAQKDKALADLESLKKSYQEIAAEALKSATETANYYRAKEGKAPIIPIAPVISESHSPSTAEQREAALVATMRASMAQVKLITKQEPRPEPPRREDDKFNEPTPVPVVTPGKVTAVDAIKAIEALETAVEEVPAKVVEKIKEQETS